MGSDTSTHGSDGKGASQLEKGEIHVHSVEASGHVSLERNFSFLACLGIAFGILNSWTARVQGIILVLPSGGSVAMIWGLLVSAGGTLAMVVSLAEACQAFPTTGGQYDWTYFLAPKGWGNALSFFVGWMGAAGWVALAACGSSLGSSFITGVISFWKPDLVIHPWQFFLLYLAWTLAAWALNTFGLRILPHVERTALYWSLTGLVVVSVTILACSSGEYQPPKNVFATFTNETGWPNGFAFILGLLQSTFGMTAFDGISHMIEEMPRPSRNAPRVMIIAVVLGTVTSWIFMIILLFCLTDLEAVLTEASGPLLQIYYQATNSRAGSTCLLVINLVAMFFATQGIHTVASRMVFSFARDRGMGPLSSVLSPVHRTLKVPARAILFVAVWVVVFGLIFLGSSVALNAVLSASVIFLQISYFVPILLLFIRGRKVLAEHDLDWSLGRLRRFINGIALAFVLLTSVCFLFPPFIPVTGTSMNYTVVVVAIGVILCAAA